MHEIRVSIPSPEAADHGVAELWAAAELIGCTTTTPQKGCLARPAD
jgi:hypothetical protein